MATLLIISGGLLLLFALWSMLRGTRREKPSPANNWENEDHISRRTDGTWAEGSTHSKSQPPDSTGLGL